MAKYLHKFVFFDNFIVEISAIMYRIATLLLSFTLLFSCKKNDKPGPVGQNEVTTMVPRPEEVTLRVVGYGTIGDRQLTGFPVYEPGNSPVNYGVFNINEFVTDKKDGRIVLNTSLNIEKEKGLPFADGTTNYVRIMTNELVHIGSHANYLGSNLEFGDGGFIKIPVNGIAMSGSGIYPGYFGPELSSQIYVNYLAPTNPYFAKQLPSYLRTDENQNRHFLWPFSYVRIAGGGFSAYNDRNNYDIYGGNRSVAELAFPRFSGSGQLQPDSIALWFLREGKWINRGYAYKTGEIYKANIRGLGAYLLANTISGRYWVIKVQTNNGAPVINATVRIKQVDRILAEAQTDWNGNATVFIPSSAQLTAEVMGSFENENQVLASLTFTSTGKVAESKIPLSGSLPSVYSLSGTATDCSGLPIEKGEILVSSQLSGMRIYMPVEKGVINAAFIDRPDITASWIANLTNLNTKHTGDDTLLLLKGGNAVNINVNNCLNRPSYFLYWNTDSESRSFQGSEMATAPTFIADNGPADTKIQVVDYRTKQSIKFTANENTAGTFNSVLIKNIEIDGKKDFSFASDKPSQVIFSRYDRGETGVVTGSADFWFRDGQNVLHNARVSFRLRKKI